MIHKPIYKPKARAREYADLAVNIYTGCNHGCGYCYAREMKQRFTPKGGACTFDNPEPRRDIVESVKRQLDKGYITLKQYGGIDIFGEIKKMPDIKDPLKNKLIHLCFTCDPYPADIDTAPTREIIQLIKASGNAVQILTKGGIRAERDFDLLDSGDWFGVTISSFDRTAGHIEPNAGQNYSRRESLKEAKTLGIKTWVSCEPVIDPQAIYNLIQTADYIDLFRIGKLNHVDAPELKAIHDSIDWAEFGQTCIELCERLGRQYYIKDDLQAEIRRAGKRHCGPRQINTLAKSHKACQFCGDAP